MRENRVEARLSSGVRSLGGISIKIVATQAGVPDRLILLPGGRSFLVEVKADGKRLRPIQEIWHERAAEIGHEVTTLYGMRDVENFLDKL